MMHLILFFTLVVAVSCDVPECNETSTAQPVRGYFRVVQNNIDGQTIKEEIDDFVAYGCEKMVVIRNKAQEDIKLKCRSSHDVLKETRIKPGNAFAFTFRPLKNGGSKYWCNLEYKQQYARFYVFNEELSYMCHRPFEEVYQYTVHHDGIYTDGKNGQNGEKIRALFKGHNKFTLWEEFHDGESDGFLISGLVDGGMCYDIPEEFNDKTAAVTVCYNHCVHLYEHYGCKGNVQTIQASNDCVDEGLVAELSGKLSALKGC